MSAVLREERVSLPARSHLDWLESEAIYILREVAGQCQNPVLLFSGGKDSAVLLRLAEKAFRPGRFPFPLMHIDTGHNFPEVIEFRDRRAAELSERLIVRSVEDSIRRGTVPLRSETDSRNAAENARSYLGRVESGAVAAGDEVLLLPGERRTRIREIHVQAMRSTSARAGDAVAIVLADDLDVARGDLLVDVRSAPRETRQPEATLVWFDTAPMRPKGRYLVQQGARRTLGRIKDVISRRDVHTLEERQAAGTVAMNDIVRATLSLQAPLFVDAYEAVRATGSFILIDEATNRTVAAGMIQ